MLSPKERRRILGKRGRRSLAITERVLGVRLKGERKRPHGKAQRSRKKSQKKAKAPRRPKGSRSRKHRMSAAQKAALRKAIHANSRMSPTSKRKALYKLS